jgi:hypothetical protein
MVLTLVIFQPPLQFSIYRSFTNPFTNINIKSLSTREVANITNLSNQKNSPEYDEISTKVLK